MSLVVNWNSKMEKKLTLLLFYEKYMENENTVLSLLFMYFIRKNICFVESDLLSYFLSMYPVDVVTIHFKTTLHFWLPDERLRGLCFLCYCHRLGFCSDKHVSKRQTMCPLCFCKMHHIIDSIRDGFISSYRITFSTSRLVHHV